MSLATQQFSMSRFCNKPIICYYVQLLYVSDFQGPIDFLLTNNRSGQVMELDLVEHDT